MSEFAYSPQGAVTASQTSSLSRDVLVAATVPIYPDSVSPIAAFVNPNTPNSFLEALAITVALDSSSPVLTHLTRSAGNQGELTWISNSLGVAALEVAAGTALLSMAPQAYGFYHDGTNLYSIQLNGTAWSVATQLGAAITGLKVAYSQSGILALYGQAASGNLVLCWQDGNGPFNYMESDVAVSSDVQVTLQDGDNGPTWYAASISNGNLTIAQGMFSATGEPSTVGTSATGGGQVVLGYWNGQAVAPAFIYVDGNGALNSYCGSSAAIPLVQKSPSVKSATGFQQAANETQPTQTIHLYSLDDSNGLWVLHQDPINPWIDNMPNFTQGQLPLTSGITRVICDMNPADVPTLFAIDAGQYIQGVNSVRLHSQDPSTNYWRTDYLRVPPAQAQTLEVTRYRTEVAVVDGNGIAVPNCSMNLAIIINPKDPTETASTLDIAANGQTYYLAPGAPVRNISTNAQGKLTFSIVANSGIAVPQITVSDNAGYGIDMTITPSAPLHSYFAGTGTLNNNLPPFDSAGATLSGATVNGSSIITNPGNCPGAAYGLNQLGTSAPAILGSGSSNATNFRAMRFDMRDPANPKVYTSTDEASLEAHLKAMPMAALTGSWLDSFAEDIVHGIEQGVTTVADASVKITGDIGNLAITIGSDTVSFAVKTAEDIGHALSSVIMWAADAIEDVIEWLKAVFDLEAIMRTQAAFVQAVKQVIGDPTVTPPVQGYIVGTLASQAGAANGWFQKQSTEINGLFASMISTYQNTGINSLPGYAAPGPPSSSPVGSSNVSPSDCTNNVHHNFIQEKVSSGGPATSPGSSDSSLAATWATFESNLGSALTDFENAIPNFLNGIQTIIANPSSAATAGIGDLLTAAQNVVNALLALADAAVQGLCAMAEEVMTSLANLLNTPITDSFLTTIWSWMGGTGTLTLLDLLALMVAFPATILYTISTGSEPFPGANTFAAMSSFAENSTIMLVGGLIQILYFVPAAASLALGPASPWPITLLMVVMSAVIFVLGGGLQDFSTVEWEDLGAAAVPIIWLTFVAFIVLQGMGAAQKQSAVDGLGDAAKLLSTVAGLLTLVFAIIAATKSSPAPSPARTASHVMLSLPQIFSLLRTKYFTGNTTAAVISGIAITVGYLGGGSAEMASTA